MPTELMYGAQYAKSFVTEYLKSDIPTRLVGYRNGWGVDDITLPTPLEYLTYEPLVLDSWPTIITVAISTRSFTRNGYAEGADPLYKVSYSMRTYVWVRTEGSKETTEMRDRLTTVIRSALLDYPCLKRTDALREARIEETTVVEEFSDLTLLKGDRVLAGSYIAYELSIDEAITRAHIADELLEIGLTLGQNPLGSAIINYTNSGSVAIS